MPFPVDERYVVLAEQLLGVRLPRVYRQKLLAENGGDLETAKDHWLLYPVWDRSDKKRLKRTCNDIVLETRGARQWSGFPQAGVAVGDNGGGDQLVLLPSVRDPAILDAVLYRLDHETGELHAIGDIADLV